MPSDSDPITFGKTPDDLTSILLDMASGIQFKFFGLMLLFFILLNSDVYINRVLSKFPGSVDHKNPTNFGTLLLGIFLVIIMAGVNVLIEQKII